MEERLQKILASYGYGARRKCEEFIINGQVAVNGIVATLGQKADGDIDEITIDGKPIKSANTRNVYILLHKHQDNHKFHFHRGCASMEDCLLEIVGHDDFQMNGRKPPRHKGRTYFDVIVDTYNGTASRIFYK